MFELIDHLGNVARMRDGKPFRYSSSELAYRGKRALQSQKDCVTAYRIREVRS